MDEYKGAVTVKPKLVSGAFVYWVDGNHPVKYTYPLVGPGYSLTPFVVRISNKGWIPANLLVFARDEHQARERVLESLRECAAKDYHGAEPGEEDRHILTNCAHRLLKEIEDGALNVEVSPYPIGLITKVSWASNDTVT